jgi:thiol-disulfide isomerase/thioredoxin
MANSPSKQVGHGKIGPTDPDILKKVTTVKESVFANVKTGGVPHVLRPPEGNPPPLLTGKDGKPEIFFYSAEFCPLCAAERWSVTVALSRFGTFKQLPLSISADASMEPALPDMPTFTFVGSEYHSDYIDFVPLEAQDRFRKPLQTPSPAQQDLLNQYKVNGFPFINVANKYVAAGVMFDPNPLKGLSQQEIANMLSDPTQDVTQKIVGAANYLTATICVVTNNQPASVCNSDPIPDMRNFLTTNVLASFSSTVPVSFVENCTAEPATCRRRENA